MSIYDPRRIGKKVQAITAAALAVVFVSVASASATDDGARPIQELLNEDGSVDLSSGFNGALDASGWRMTTDGDGAPRFVPQVLPPSSGPRAAGDNDRWIGRFSASGAAARVRVFAVHLGTLYAAGEFTAIGGVEARHVARWTGSSWAPLAGGVDGTVHAMASYGAHLVVAGEFDNVRQGDGGELQVNNVAFWEPGADSWSAIGGSATCVAGRIGESCDDDCDCQHMVEVDDAPAQSFGDCDTPGTTALVRALAVDGGSLYLGGEFTSVEDRQTAWRGPFEESCPSDTAPGGAHNRVVRWDGDWHDMGDGVNGRVRALLTAPDGIYVAGNFTEAGGVSRNKIARWSGGVWNTVAGALGSTGVDNVCTAGGNIGGLCLDDAGCDSFPGANNGFCDKSGYVSALAAVGGQVYAGGSFASIGAGLARNVASWNGASWSPLSEGSGTDGVSAAVASMAVVGDQVFVGGGFEFAGEDRSEHLAVWDEGDSTWSSLADGPNGTVAALGALGAQLFVGGEFSLVDNVATNRIAIWDTAGSSWTAFRDGGEAGLSNPIRAFAVIGTDLYVGGEFASAGGVPLKRLGRWDGVSWWPVGGGVNGTVLALETDGTDLYVGGAFSSVVDTEGANVVAHGIAKWDTASLTWSSLGGGVRGTVHALALSGDQIYVGGRFDQAVNLHPDGEIPIDAKGIALWDETAQAWSALGPGIGNQCASDDSGNPNIGNFCTSHSQCVAPMIEGFCLGSEVRAIAEHAGEVFVGGSFRFLGDGTEVNNIATWDPLTSQWATLVAAPGRVGLDGAVSALAEVDWQESDDLRLFVGGEFIGPTGSFGFGSEEQLNYVARWNHALEEWEALNPNDTPDPVAPGLEQGVTGPVYALDSVDGGLLLGGGFFAASSGFDSDARFIALWSDPPGLDGPEWSKFGDGTNDTVRALAVMRPGGGSSADSLFAGGRFTRTGQHVSVFLGQYALGACGDGIVNGGEACDAAVPGACCNATTCALGGAGAVCRGAVGICDNDEVCDGAAIGCPADALTPAGTQCRAQVDPDCDIEEQCNGVDAGCPLDIVATAGTLCRAQAGICDVAESCDGENPVCPADAVEAKTVVCRGAVGDCDAEEFCNGSATACGEDRKIAGLCRAAVDECDAPEFCDGLIDNCPTDAVRSAGAACTDDGEQCTEDICDGAGVACTHPNRTGACEDGDFCTGPDVCSAGACVTAGPIDCDDGDLCTADSCDSGVGCVNTGMVLPSESCLEAEVGRFRVFNPFGSENDRIVWRWRRGAAFDDSGLGTPEFDTQYSLCLYDQTADMDEFAASFNFAPGDLWQNRGSRGLRYKDKFGVSSGLKKMDIRTGSDGKTGLKVEARGSFLPTPTPIDNERMFAQDSSLRAQLVNSEGTCWTSEFPAEGNSVNAPWKFKTDVDLR